MIDSVITGAGQVNSYLPIISDKILLWLQSDKHRWQKHLVDLLLSKACQNKENFHS